MPQAIPGALGIPFFFPGIGHDTQLYPRSAQGCLPTSPNHQRHIGGLNVVLMNKQPIKDLIDNF
jgi:hypothetical protein